MEIISINSEDFFVVKLNPALGQGMQMQPNVNFYHFSRIGHLFR